jgi:hypothetical protein
VRLVVVRIDGVTSVFTLAPDLRADGYRIVDHRFSPSGARVAATVSSVGIAVRCLRDVAAARGRLTTTEDVLAAGLDQRGQLLVRPPAASWGGCERPAATSCDR